MKPSAPIDVSVVRPVATDEALINPGMGWVFYKYSNRIWAYGVNTPTEDTLDWFPGCSTIYMRLTWNDLEPEEGDYRWEIFDTFAQPWIAKGKKIALRVMTCSQVEEGTPEFVRQAGRRREGAERRRASRPLPAAGEERFPPVRLLGARQMGASLRDDAQAGDVRARRLRRLADRDAGNRAAAGRPGRHHSTLRPRRSRGRRQ